MANQISKSPINNVFLNGQNKPQYEALVHDITGNWNDWGFWAGMARKNMEKNYGIKDTGARQVLADTLPSKKVEAFFGKISKFVLYDPNRTAVVGATSTVLAGNKLRVTFTDPTLNIFRPTDNLTDGGSANNLVRVVQAFPGYVICEPTDNAQTLTTSMYTAGSNVFAYSQTSGWGNSTAVQSIYQFPNSIDFQTGVHRGNIELSKYMDTGNTWMQTARTLGDDSPQAPWYLDFQRQLENQLFREQSWKYFMDKMGTFSNSSLPGGVVTYGKGWIDSIKDPVNGGCYMPFFSAPTLTTLETWFNRIRSRRSATESGNTAIPIVAGAGWRNMVSLLLRPFIQTAGDRNTFGGVEVKGFDIMKYDFAGCRIDIMGCNFLDNPFALKTQSNINNYPRIANCAMALDFDSYPTPQGGRMPALEEIYYGNAKSNYYIVPGPLSKKNGFLDMFGDGFEGATMADPTFAATHIPSDNYGCIRNTGLANMPYRQGFMEDCSV